MELVSTWRTQGYDLWLIQDYLGHRDPKHTVHYTRVAGVRFEGLWESVLERFQVIPSQEPSA